MIICSYEKMQLTRAYAWRKNELAKALGVKRMQNKL